MKILSASMFSFFLLNIVPGGLSSFFSGPIVSFLIVIGVSVTIHELGHFLAAKISKVGVLKFAVGFGPALFKKTYKGTEYRIGILPLGGYVRMVGDMPDMITGPQATDDEVRNQSSPESLESEDLSPEVKAMIADKSCWFIEKSNWIKAFIVFAGPFANYLLALVLVATASLIYGIQVPDGTRIDRISSESPADVAGIEGGDELLSIEGKPVANFLEIQEKIQASKGKKIEVVLRRNGELQTFDVIPEERPSPLGLDEKVYMVGIIGATKHETVPFIKSISSSFAYVNHTVLAVVSGLYGLVSGNVPLESVGGPIMIYQVAGKTASKGFDALLYFIAYLNISLGVLNLLPIPVLDGGHLLIFFMEGILGPISNKKKEFFQGIGMAFILCLSIFAIHNDLTRKKDYLNPPSEDWKEMGKSDLNEAP